MSTPILKNQPGTHAKIALAQRLGAIEEHQQAPKERKKLDQGKVNEAFRKFLDKDYPSLDHYDLKGESLVVEVFAYYEESSVLLNHDGLTAGDVYGRHTFAVARVLHSSPTSAYRKGEIVKLRDSDAATIPNPRYEMWVNNPYSKSNTERLGEEMPAVINNLWAAFGTKIFKINPLKQDMIKEDWLIFKINDANIECQITNPDALL
jgi:hypothetical protein